ncbi:MAG: hypothetical protein PF572_04445 [Patescibacteria group bacterium]|jgi:hypothetical protein|nr:hypothetical protein [Patescibacteria group bacterium]
MKMIFLLLLLTIVPCKIKAEENRDFEIGANNIYWQEKFHENLSRVEPENPKYSLVFKAFFDMIRKHNPPIDRLAHWAGENLGTFMPSGIISLKKDGEINHKKINVNIFNGGDEKKKMEEVQKKETLLFEYELVPIVHSRGKLGLRINFKKIVGKINFSWENRLEDYKRTEQEVSRYHTSSILWASFYF